MQEIVLTVRAVATPTGYQVAALGGPRHDKALCFGLLEAAKDALRDHLANQRAGAVQTPTPAQAKALLAGAPHN